ncbi:MAG: hypothetical protein ABL986_06405 [Vicinamibacterales bacterium]
MLNRFRTAAGLLRPRSLARTARSVEDLQQVTSRLSQVSKDSATESSRLQREVLAVKDALEAAEQRESKLSAELRELRGLIGRVQLRESQLSAIYLRDRELAAEIEGLASVLDAEAVMSHARDAIMGAELVSDPFPHMVVENVWPESFYRALIEGLPPVELFGDGPPNKRQLKVPFCPAPIYSERVWSFLTGEVLDGLVASCLIDKFSVPLKAWLRDNFSLSEGDPTEGIRFKCSDGRILLRSCGYLIPPHRDPKWGFITCLSYLVRPGDSERWGTQLYSVGDDVEAPSVAPYWIKADRCRFEKDVPFRRNSMLVFLNSHGAHGASIPADAKPPNLERYVYQFRIGPGPAAIRSLVRLLPEERHSFWSGKVTDY